jgi:hypothetical protein
MLLTREEFKEQVFARDKGCCVICGTTAVDAHHIIGRKYFSDGGYYLNNGASLCEVHHMDAETDRISAEYLYAVCGIRDVVVPDIDTPLTKYPRTFHFPWSPNLQNDDRMLESIEGFVGREVVVTEKMDGENTTMYRDAIHARSLDSGVHPTRYWVRGLWGAIKYEIPQNMRICGENLYAKHSILYNDLPTYFMVFNIWQDDTCLSWDETVEWCGLLGLNTVPVIYRGPWDQEHIRSLWNERDDSKEGYVVRVADSFSLLDYSRLVGKYVRQKHIRTSEHWMHQSIIPNGLRMNEERSIQTPFKAGHSRGTASHGPR